MTDQPQERRASILVEQNDAHEALLSEFRAQRAATPDVSVYHYTSDVGVFEILKSGLLWLSDFTTLNDPTELSHGIDVGLDALRAEVSTRGNDPLEADFVGGIENVYSRGLHSILRGYVLSLSLEPDELTQWRSYGGVGAGYCVGFDSLQLDRALHAFGGATQNIGYSSFEVLYNDALLVQTMLPHIRISLNALRRLLAPNDAQLKKLAVDLLYAMMFKALYFKHHAYRSEREYRILLLSSGFEPEPAGLQKRATRNDVVDYLTLDWKSSFASALRSIKVGPAANMPKSLVFLQKAKDMYLPSNFSLTIDQSTIPFRG